ncbi:hypothetical protein CALVIDRAFT_150738 [Calocera viscosa TUFC12733]|uniref:Uncharacterized protein n=1 Tax=Calocera viscosa (strain TUFC12733) TaxID=1330018 RepID=A0A167LJP6_CALVF|nr:hypothetical protein CALVIDRAFT_150738 [Calocera viscosa TUFC12733]
MRHCFILRGRRTACCIITCILMSATRSAFIRIRDTELVWHKISVWRGDTAITGRMFHLTTSGSITRPTWQAIRRSTLRIRPRHYTSILQHLAQRDKVIEELHEFIFDLKRQKDDAELRMKVMTSDAERRAREAASRMALARYDMLAAGNALTLCTGLELIMELASFAGTLKPKLDLFDVTTHHCLMALQDDALFQRLLEASSVQLGCHVDEAMKSVGTLHTALSKLNNNSRRDSYLVLRQPGLALSDLAATHSVFRWSTDESVDPETGVPYHRWKSPIRWYLDEPWWSNLLSREDSNDCDPDNEW